MSRALTPFTLLLAFTCKSTKEHSLRKILVLRENQQEGVVRGRMNEWKRGINTCMK